MQAFYLQSGSKSTDCKFAKSPSAGDGGPGFLGFWFDRAAFGGGVAVGVPDGRPVFPGDVGPAAFTGFQVLENQNLAGVFLCLSSPNDSVHVPQGCVDLPPGDATGRVQPVVLSVGFRVGESAQPAVAGLLAWRRIRLFRVATWIVHPVTFGQNLSAQSPQTLYPSGVTCCGFGAVQSSQLARVGDSVCGSTTNDEINFLY